MALDLGYPELAKKSESYEICFVPDNDYRGFLKRNVEGIDDKLKGGLFVDKHGKILGKHSGYPFYTIGQRKGLEVTLGKPVFVTAIDPNTNTVVLGDEEDLLKNEMHVGQINLIKYDHIDDGMEASVKIRYKDSGNEATLYNNERGIRVHFYDNAKGIAPGQSAVFYDGDDVIGGGIIQRENIS
jgi:tRNA-specific 2-thiouridylase